MASGILLCFPKGHYSVLSTQCSGHHHWASLPQATRVCVCVCVCACARAHSVTQSCTTLCDPIDYSPPVSSVHGISQARILECIAISYTRESFNPGLEPTSLASPPLAGGFFTTSATWEALMRVKCICFALECEAQGWPEWTQIRTLGGYGWLQDYRQCLPP